ncbi:MAG: hypothetical protein JO296_16505 [Pseudonocardiales bacterium]|nr:hypothetical protein [Pseudonocardiales bacterium]
MDTPPTTPPPGEEKEAQFDTYAQEFGPIFGDGFSDRYRVTVTFSDCTDVSCRDCYEPIMLSIDRVDAEPREPVQLDITNGWGEVDKLIEALTAACAAHRSTT